MEQQKFLVEGIVINNQLLVVNWLDNVIGIREFNNPYPIGTHVLPGVNGLSFNDNLLYRLSSMQRFIKFIDEHLDTKLPPKNKFYLENISNGDLQYYEWELKQGIAEIIMQLKTDNNPSFSTKFQK